MYLHIVTQEHADQYVWDYLDSQLQPTEIISETGTVDNLVGMGYSLEEIVEGIADNDILDAIVWLD